MRLNLDELFAFLTSYVFDGLTPHSVFNAMKSANNNVTETSQAEPDSRPEGHHLARISYHRWQILGSTLASCLLPLKYA